MPDLRLNETRVLVASTGRGDGGAISEPERELLNLQSSAHLILENVRQKLI